MHVMEIVSGKRPNGAIIHCRILARELAHRGHRVTVVCRHGAWIRQQLESDSIGVEIVESELDRWPFDELRRVSAIVRRRDVDVVHTHMSRAHAFGALLRWFGSVPSVATAQCRHIQLHWMLNDYVIAASEATRRYHRKYNLVGGRRIGTIHNFIDDRRFTDVASGTRSRVRSSLGLRDENLLLGIVGDVTERKGLIHLVGALPQILEKAPQARLLVIGKEDKAYVERVRATGEQLGVSNNVLWLGSRDDVPEILAALDLFVLPTLEETMPLSVLEAMAAGLPVVATRVGGIPECVDNGVTGLLVPPADEDPLAETISMLLGNPLLRQAFGEAGQARIGEYFSLESQVSRIETVLANVARGRRQAA